jgi:hypothetical protein
MPPYWPRGSTGTNGAIMTAGLRIGGVVLILVGLVWIGQGIGIIHGSFMTGDAVWAFIGSVTLVVGLVLIGVAASRRDRRRDPDS